MLHHIIKDAQTPLPVCPRPVGTLEQTEDSLVSYCWTLSMWCAESYMIVTKGGFADWEWRYLLLAGQWAAAAVQTKAGPSLCNYWTQSAGCLTLWSRCTRHSHPVEKQERWRHRRWHSPTSWTQDCVFYRRHEISSWFTSSCNVSSTCSS